MVMPALTILRAAHTDSKPEKIGKIILLVLTIIERMVSTANKATKTAERIQKMKNNGKEKVRDKEKNKEN